MNTNINQPNLNTNTISNTYEFNKTWFWIVLIIILIIFISTILVTYHKDTLFNNDDEIKIKVEEEDW